MEFHCKTFDELTKMELHDILKLRTDVFVVEQVCPYDEIDGKDPEALHLFHEDNGEIITVGRILLPSKDREHPSIGRVVVREDYRGKGLGELIMKEAMRVVREKLGDVQINLSAQDYLVNFYESLGFKPVSEPYDWDGIIHVDMVYL